MSDEIRMIYEDDYLEVAGLTKLDSETREIYMETFNNHYIFEMDKEERMSHLEKNADIMDELVTTAALLIYRGKNYASNGVTFDGEMCFNAVSRTIKNYDKLRKTKDGKPYKPFHLFLYIYCNNESDNISANNSIKLTSTVVRLGNDIRRIVEDKYEGNMDFIEKAIDEINNESNNKHHKDTWDAAKRYAQKLYYSISLDERINDDEETTLGDVTEDKRSNIEDILFAEDGGEFLDKMILLTDTFTTAKDEENYRMIITNKMLRGLKLDENKHPYKELPAGNGTFYNVLIPRADELMRRLFIQEYIEREIESEPESLKCLYGVYYNYLQGKLNNKEMSSFLGKSESSFAQTQKRMMGKMEEGLLKNE